MTDQAATVLIVDDDESVLRALRRLVIAAGFNVQAFAGPRELLAAEIPTSNACFLLDFHLPDMNGVDLHAALVASGRGLPAIMITGKSDTRTQSLLRRANAVAVLSKPVDAGLLLNAIELAVSRSHTS